MNALDRRVAPLSVLDTGPGSLRTIIFLVHIILHPVIIIILLFQNRVIVGLLHIIVVTFLLLNGRQIHMFHTRRQVHGKIKVSIAFILRRLMVRLRGIIEHTLRLSNTSKHLEAARVVQQMVLNWCVHILYL
jgi:hypothetical protein